MSPKDLARDGSAAVLEAVRTGHVRDIEAERRAARDEAAVVAEYGPLRPCTLAELWALRESDVGRARRILWAETNGSGAYVRLHFDGGRR